MPVLNTEAGIDCIDCGHCVVVKTRKDADDLAAELKWVDGNPVCPECGSSITFHGYIDG